MGEILGELGEAYQTRAEGQKNKKKASIHDRYTSVFSDAVIYSLQCPFVNAIQAWL